MSSDRWVHREFMCLWWVSGGSAHSGYLQWFYPSTYWVCQFNNSKKNILKDNCPMCLMFNIFPRVHFKISLMMKYTDLLFAVMLYNWDIILVCFAQRQLLSIIITAMWCASMITQHIEKTCVHRIKLKQQLTRKTFQTADFSISLCSHIIGSLLKLHNTPLHEWKYIQLSVCH